MITGAFPEIGGRATHRHEMSSTYRILQQKFQLVQLSVLSITVIIYIIHHVVSTCACVCVYEGRCVRCVGGWLSSTLFQPNSRCVTFLDGNRSSDPPPPFSQLNIWIGKVIRTEVERVFEYLCVRVWVVSSQSALSVLFQHATCQFHGFSGQNHEVHDNRCGFFPNAEICMYICMYRVMEAYI